MTHTPKKPLSDSARPEKKLSAIGIPNERFEGADVWLLLHRMVLERVTPKWEKGWHVLAVDNEAQVLFVEDLFISDVAKPIQIPFGAVLDIRFEPSGLVHDYYPYLVKEVTGE